MNILHAHYLPDISGLFFWAESPEAAAPRPSRGRPAQNPKPKAHPYAIAPDLSGERHTITLQLPSVKGIPFPSPQLVHPWDIPASSPVLAPFLVDGVVLPPEDVLPVLLDFSACQLDPAKTCLPSQGFNYWRKAASLVLETLASQKYLPIVVKNDARWLPVLDSPKDAQRITQLINAMPPVCRAEHPEISPRILLTSFLNTFCDALIRTWGKTTSVTRFQRDDDPAYQWLSALFAEDPKIRFSSNQLQAFTFSHNAWMRNLYVAGDAAFRIAFRLESPASQDESWQLHYLIQAKDDPSLLISAGEVWNKTGGVLTHLGHRFEQPQEKLLAGLGYAARVFPPVADSLKSKRPTELAVDTSGAYHFLRETAPLLESAGFGILVPPWWTKKSVRLGIRVKMKSKNDATASGFMTMKNLIDYDWKLSLGETELTKEEFYALANLKSPLVQIRGQWVALDAEQIEAAIAFWEKQKSDDQLDLLEAMRMGLGGETSVDGLPIDTVDAEGWLSTLLEQISQPEKLEELSQPEGLLGQLRPYQTYGFSWLAFLRRWGLGACLADDMGLGKTIQTISLLVYEKQLTGKLPAPALLVAPTSVVTNWEREIARFAPSLQTYVHRGTNRLRDEAFCEAIQNCDVVLTSYPMVRSDAPFLQSIQWLAVILDEAQNIKNPETKQSQAIRKLDADFRIALTGTPVENRLSDLWSIMHFLNPGYLGARKAFREHFALPIERYQDQAALIQLKQLTSPFILRRVKTDPRVISDLPEKVETKVHCMLTEEQATLYEAVVQDAMQRIAEEDGIQRRGLVLSMMMQLKQICNHPVQYLHQTTDEKMGGRSGKLERLVALLEEILAVGDKALIFTQFAEMGGLLEAYLPKALCTVTQYLHGGTQAKARDQMVRRFQEDEHAPPIFILSLKAGGTGLNLTRANHVFHFDRWWNPAVENQATDRAFRIGQKRNVQVHKFVMTGTLEEMIDEMIEAKKDLAQAVVGSGENWLTEMSTEELQKMVSLRRE